MTNDLHQLAKKFIEGEWAYDANAKILKRTFASDTELAELGLIDKDGYLDSGLKKEMTHLLNDIISGDLVGSFGDSDIFSGDIYDDVTFYNIELHQISDEVVEGLKAKYEVSVVEVRFE